MLRLEVFEPALDPASAEELGAAEAEELRKSAYENGYSAGWDDATHSLKSAADTRVQAVQDALQALSFTYEEAHAALMRSFHPLVAAMVTQIMPEAAKLSIPGLLAGELDRIAADTTRLPVTIVCAPTARDVVLRACDSFPALEVNVVDEPAYAEAQMTIRFDQQERAIDLECVLELMRNSFASNVPDTASSNAASEVRHG